MDGLASGDYDALGEAIRRERDVIEIQADLIAEQRDATADQHPVPIGKDEETAD